MKQVLGAFVSGVLFGVGLIIAQMTDPSKVIGFLNLTGAWDPSLAFVMVGAIGVYATAYWLTRGSASLPVLAHQFHLPAIVRVDRQLIAGAAVFGAGWGLSGFCPGPAVVSSGFGEPRVWVFAASMLAGMLIYRLRLGRSQAEPDSTPAS